MGNNKCCCDCRIPNSTLAVMEKIIIVCCSLTNSASQALNVKKNK